MSYLLFVDLITFVDSKAFVIDHLIPFVQESVKKVVKFVVEKGFGKLAVGCVGVGAWMRVGADFEVRN